MPICIAAAVNGCFSTAQKMKFSIKDFLSKRDKIRSFLRIWSYLLKKSLIENFIFCAVFLLEEHSKSCQISKTEHVEKIINSFRPIFGRILNTPLSLIRFPRKKCPMYVILIYQTRNN